MLADDLARWAAEARADEAGRARARQRWLRRQAEEEATFAALLVDLAERCTTVAVRTSAGRRHRAVVVTVAGDFVLLRPDRGWWLLLPFGSITTVRAVDGGGEVAAGRRPPTLDLVLGEALEAMAGDRARVAIVTTGDPELTAGELEAVGEDVVTVRLDGPARDRVFVRLPAVVEVAVETR